MKYSAESIQKVVKALRNESAGNEPCTMADLDLAVSMLESQLKERFMNNYTFTAQSPKTGKLKNITCSSVRSAGRLEAKLKKANVNYQLLG